MATQNLEAIQAFRWERQPKAEALVREFLDDFLKRNSFAANLARRMKDETGTRFYDWVDYISPPGTLATLEMKTRVLDAGFELDPVDENADIFRNSHGIFPAIGLHPKGDGSVVHIKVDSVADFLSVHQVEQTIWDEPFAPHRIVFVHSESGTDLYVAERRGSAAYDRVPPEPKKRIAAAAHLERFRLRRRNFATDAEGYAHAHKLADAAIADLGTDQTCALFFQAEREFWQRRNRAAQIQKSRQDRLGLGWANHDHHTYRSSRASFKDLVAFHEKLGCICRERFYAGREAGWGAQVMENPRAGIVTFNDVDLSPEELMEDFAHDPLPLRPTLGTVGLWCALHGEAFLQAGMHHLECQFDFDALRAQLQLDGVNTMKPFTDSPHLRQAFTEGERWPVAHERIEKLLAANLITPQQAEQFRTQGAIGSHLENLERNEGFKGFNQKGVSEIISATDPRKQVK
jgi:hypothetical protein